MAATVIGITAWSISIHLCHKNVNQLVSAEIKICLTDQWYLCHTKVAKMLKGSENWGKVLYHSSCNFVSWYLDDTWKSKKKKTQKKNQIKIHPVLPIPCNLFQNFTDCKLYSRLYLINVSWTYYVRPNVGYKKNTESNCVASLSCCCNDQWGGDVLVY